MEIKNNGSVGTAYKRIKGFTLVEMVVVIAIIAILAGIINLAVQGFIRDARRETANDNAHLLFTGFQNILTQCEIKQDNSVISPTFANDTTLTNVTVSFKTYNGNVQIFDINGAQGVYNTQFSGSMLKYIDGGTKGSAALPNAIAGIIDNTFEGEVKVYLDCVNYEVKSVVYKPMMDGNRDNTIHDFSDGELTSYAWGLGFNNADEQITAYDDHSKPLYGVYPFQAAVS